MMKVTAFLGNKTFAVIRNNENDFYKITISPTTGEEITIPTHPGLFGKNYTWGQNAQAEFNRWRKAANQTPIPHEMWDGIAANFLNDAIPVLNFWVKRANLATAFAEWQRRSYRRALSPAEQQRGEALREALQRSGEQFLTPSLMEHFIANFDPAERSELVMEYRAVIEQWREKFERERPTTVTYTFGNADVHVTIPARLKNFERNHAAVSSMDEDADVRFLLHAIVTLEKWAEAGETPHIGPFSSNGVRLSLFGRDEYEVAERLNGVKSYLGLTTESSDVRLIPEIDWSKDQDFGWEDDFGAHVEYWDAKDRSYVRSSMSGLTSYAIYFNDVGVATKFNVPLNAVVCEGLGYQHGIQVVMS